MRLAPGTRIGPYEVIEIIGAGGMGEVYRARDTKLHRDIALKVLPDVFAADPERLARFQREARTLAGLNHPHIAQIYGLEEINGVRAIAMELVDGEDLAARMQRGALPPEEALPIARQIAEALGQAHEQGVIHRDLKPANIKVRDDGTVKVLDFGLAKAFDQANGAGPPLANSPTETGHGTNIGVLVGTASYIGEREGLGLESSSICGPASARAQRVKSVAMRAGRPPGCCTGLWDGDRHRSIGDGVISDHREDLMEAISDAAAGAYVRVCDFVCLPAITIAVRLIACRVVCPDVVLVLRRIRT